MEKPERISNFIWAERFALYLASQRSDICPLEAFKLGYQYIDMLPNLITVNPIDVVNDYIEGETR